MQVSVSDSAVDIYKAHSSPCKRQTISVYLLTSLHFFQPSIDMTIIAGVYTIVPHSLEIACATVLAYAEPRGFVVGIKPTASPPQEVQKVKSQVLLEFLATFKG